MMIKRHVAVLGIAATLGLGACGGYSMGAEDGGVYYPGTEEYVEWTENTFVDASVENTSTFSIDVDTASYTQVRNDLENGIKPPPQSVRPEEFANYFDYEYVEPSGEHPFSINLEAAPSEFGAIPGEVEGEERPRHLLRVGLRGKHIDKADMKDTNLVFLVDTSGSMKGEKLKLVEYALHTLTDNLRETDTIGIVTYAGKERVLLEPTELKREGRIRRRINRLTGLGGGSTNGEAGIVKAMEMLLQVAEEGANNRVVILTDGDFNVGKSGDQLVDYVKSFRDEHLSLTAIGVGNGNFKDATMENLAKEANGNYFYLDSEAEADRVFGRDVASTLEVIASDVKIQVEFDDTVVERYRLIGYENRVLDNRDFENDAKDAGEIGPDHRVTAFYEVELAEDASADAALAQVRLRYKKQFGEDSIELTQDLKMKNVRATFDEASVDFRLGAAVVEFAEILRESQHTTGANLDRIEEIAGEAIAIEDVDEFIELVDAARPYFDGSEGSATPAP